MIARTGEKPASGNPEAMRRFGPVAELSLAMALSGTVGVFVVQSGLPPVSVVFWRCVFGSAFLGLWCGAGGSFREATGRGAGFGMLCGVLIVLNWIGLFEAYRLISIATATIVYHIQPFLVLFAGAALLREPVTRDQIVWMLAAFAGVVLASGAFTPGIATGADWLPGIAITLGAAMLSALTTLLAKHMPAQRPEVTAFWQTVTGVVLLAPFRCPRGIPASFGLGMAVRPRRHPHGPVLRAYVCRLSPPDDAGHRLGDVPLSSCRNPVRPAGLRPSPLRPAMGRNGADRGLDARGAAGMEASAPRLKGEGPPCREPPLSESAGRFIDLPVEMARERTFDRRAVPHCRIVAGQREIGDRRLTQGFGAGTGRAVMRDSGGVHLAFHGNVGGKALFQRRLGKNGRAVWL